MTDESAFLDALRADPLDHATRAVYCDWLEERGDQRAEYLRNEIALAGIPINDPRWPALAYWVRGRMDGHSSEWARVACPRYDVWLHGLGDPARKIAAIKEVRLQTGCGLARGKDLVEQAPSRVIAGVVFFLSLPAAGALLRAVDAKPLARTVSLWPSVAEPPGGFEARPNTFLEGWFHVQCYPRSSDVEAYVAALARIAGWEPDRARLAATSQAVIPCRTREEAEAVEGELSGLAWTKVWEGRQLKGGDCPLDLWQGHKLERPG